MSVEKKSQKEFQYSNICDNIYYYGATKSIYFLFFGAVTDFFKVWKIQIWTCPLYIKMTDLTSMPQNIHH